MSPSWPVMAWDSRESLSDRQPTTGYKPVTAVRPQTKRAKHYQSRLARYTRLVDLLQEWATTAREPGR